MRNGRVTHEAAGAAGGWLEYSALRTPHSAFAMRLAHLADLHLGFRQYYRQTSQGINQREADVAVAFRRVVDDVIAAQPELILVAGDVFHSVRPGNPAILDAFNQFRRLSDALPGVSVIIIAGDHDTPRSVETGTILRLFEALPAFHVVVHEAKRLSFPQWELSVLCVPFAAFAGEPRPDLDVDPDARRNILLMHGELAGLPRDYDPGEHGIPTLEPSELHAERWDYVALGHYHVARQMAPNAWYSGSIEYVSRNPWGDLKQEKAQGRAGEKGWLLVELQQRTKVKFQPVELARRHVDLEPINASGRSAEQLDEEIASRVAAVKNGIEDQIVRQLVYEVSRLVARELKHEAIRDYKTRALHYHLDLRRPESRREVGVGGPGGKARTLADIVVEYLERRPTTPGVDRHHLVALGRRYVEDAERERGER
ncbi:MAG: DNA repair exonuclease [Gemmatimonadetes bacterium]|nr:DNA repair exonuclease [Gemmatimonadota bacterium]